MADPAADDAARRVQSRVGRIFKEKWHIDRVLGVGGFGAVYAATHRTRKRVAIKILHPELTASPEMRARFMREAYAANAVDHPGVVSIFDDDVAEDGSAFLVMELCDGETVADRAERSGGALPPGEVIFVADQLLDVLAAAHEKGVLHRDLKPDNLFLTRAGPLKVLDFGIARLREGGGLSTTRSGALMGTPAFMPPEQARGKWREVDERTDLWAVGATMFTLLTGRLVHEAPTAPEMLIASMNKPAPRLASLLPAVPASLAEVVDRALAFQKEARWPDARRMQEALRRSASALLGAASAPVIVVPRAAGETPPPAMNRADSAAFARTLAAEKTLASGALQQSTDAPVATGGSPAPAPARGRTIALAAFALVVGGGLAFVGVGVVQRARDSASAAAPPSGSAEPEASSTAPAAPEPSVAPTATAVAGTPEASATASAPTPGARLPRNPAGTRVPLPSKDPFSRRR